MDRSAATAVRFDSAAQEAYLNLWRTYDRLRAIEDDLFARYDLSAQQYNALRLLRAAHPEPLPTLALADRLVTRAPDITRLIDKLDARGLVRRERPPHDRRTVLVALQPAGRDLLAKVAGPLRRCHERQLGHLAPAELETLVRLLKAARAPHEPDPDRWG